MGMARCHLWTKLAPPQLWGGGARRRRGCDQSTGQRRVLPIYGEVARSAGGAVTVPRDQVMDKVVALAKRRGFIFPSSEIYGGLSGFYDYGPYGVALKRAIRDLWWRHMVDPRDDVVGLESTLMMPSAVWEASGHLTNFVDPLRQCLGKCKKRWRADRVLGQDALEGRVPPDDTRLSNHMFKSHVEMLEDCVTAA